MKMIEERRLLTVLFADLSGFTALSSTLDPEQVTEFVNICFEHLNKPIIREGGMIHKYEGDLVIALFGLPASHEDDPERAIRAGLAMIGLMPEVNAELSRALKTRTDVGLHIGINSGTVVVGEVGSKEKKEFTIMGDVVNLCSRLKDVAKNGEIIVSEPVFRASHYLFDYEARPAVNLKGITEPIRIYQPKKLKDKPDPKRGIKGLYSPMLGRDREFEKLKAAVQDLNRGAAGVFFILGNAGLGKSRLSKELNRDITDRRLALTTLAGRCISYGETTPYWPFLQILENLFDVTENDSQKAFQEKLNKKIKTLFPEEWTDIIAYIGFLFSMHLADNLAEKVKFLEAKDLKIQIKITIKKLLFALARFQPLMLVIDDYQWIDRESLDLLEFIFDPLTISANNLPPILLLALSRIDKEAPPYETRKRLKQLLAGSFQEVVLEPLDDETTSRLVANLLKIENNPGLAGQIRAKAAGNPYYVEEIIRSLIDQGLLVFRDGAWSMDQNIPAIRMPDTIQSVIASRLDKLNHDLRDVLQRASVIGRNFYAPVLEQLCPVDPLILTVHLATLEEYEHIAATRHQPETEYQFRNPLIHEVVYNSLLIRRRRELHRKTGELIEKIYQDRLEEFTDQLAFQYSNSDHPGKAVEWLKKAGERAKNRYANDEAIGYYQKLTLALADLHPAPADELWPAYESLAEIFELKGDYDMAIKHYRDMDKAAAGKNIIQARARQRIANILSLQCRFEAMSEMLASAEGLLAGDSVEVEIERSEACLLRCVMHHKTGELRKSIDDGEGLIKIIDGLKKNQMDTVAKKRLTVLAIRAYSSLATSFMLIADFNRAFDLYEKSLNIARESGVKQHVGKALLSLGTFMGRKGEFKKAIEFELECLKIFEEIGNKFNVGHTIEKLAYAYWGLGQIDKAIEYYGAFMKIAEEVGDREGIAGTCINLGGLYSNKGQFEKIGALYERAQKIYADIGHSRGLAIVTGNRGGLAEVGGDYEKALDYYRESKLLFEKTGNKLDVAMNQAEYAYISLVRAEYAKAEALYRDALRVFVEAGAKWEIAFTSLQLGSLYLTTGDLDQARSQLTQAEAMINEIGERFILISLYRYRVELNLREQEIRPETWEYAEKAMQLSRESNSELEQGHSFSLLGALYAAINEFSKADDNYRESIKIFEKINHRKILADTYLAYGRMLKKGSLQGAFPHPSEKKYLDRALAIYREIGLPHKVKEIEALNS